MLRCQVNVSNAVNIKQVVCAAKSVKVVVLISHDSIKADRGRGVSDTVRTLVQLFGSAERLQKHLHSVVVVITHARLRDNNNNLIKADKITSLLYDTSGMDGIAATVVERLARKALVYHACDKGDGSWSTRDALLEVLRAAVPITDPSDVFRTVLNAEDEKMLRGVCSNLSKKISKHFEKQQYKAMAKCMQKLDIVRAAPQATTALSDC
jgi:hypothetical protein